MTPKKRTAERDAFINRRIDWASQR